MLIGLLNKPTDAVVGIRGRIIFTVALAGGLVDQSITIMSITLRTGFVGFRTDSAGNIEGTLHAGEKQSFDLDQDRKADIFLHFVQVEGNLVRLRLGLSAEEPQLRLPTTEQGERAAEEQPALLEQSPVQKFFQPEREGRNALYLLILMGVAVAVVFIGKYLRSRTKGRSKQQKL